jgi:hypothetical protein
MYTVTDIKHNDMYMLLIVTTMTCTWFFW